MDKFTRKIALTKTSAGEFSLRTSRPQPENLKRTGHVEWMTSLVGSKGMFGVLPPIVGVRKPFLRLGSKGIQGSLAWDRLRQALPPPKKGYSPERAHPNGLPKTKKSIKENKVPPKLESRYGRASGWQCPKLEHCIENKIREESGQKVKLYVQKLV